jgi:hypothetical protein
MQIVAFMEIVMLLAHKTSILGIEIPQLAKRFSL